MKENEPKKLAQGIYLGIKELSEDSVSCNIGEATLQTSQSDGQISLGNGFAHCSFERGSTLPPIGEEDATSTKLL